MFGVGYRRWGAEPTFWRFAGRGRPGDDEGSKGGSRDGAGRFSGDGAVDEAVDEVDDADDVVVVVGAGSATSAAAGFGVGESMAAAAVNVLRASGRDHALESLRRLVFLLFLAVILPAAPTAIPPGPLRSPIRASRVGESVDVVCYYELFAPHLQRLGLTRYR